MDFENLSVGLELRTPSGSQSFKIEQLDVDRGIKVSKVASYIPFAAFDAVIKHLKDCYADGSVCLLGGSNDPKKATHLCLVTRAYVKNVRVITYIAPILEHQGKVSYGKIGRKTGVKLAG